MNGLGSAVRRIASILWGSAAIMLALVAQSVSGLAQSRVTLNAEIEGQPIQVMLYRPDGPGPFPLVVVSHGSPRDASGRSRIGPDTQSRQAEALTREGFAVAVPLRRGYGGQGIWAEGYGRCDDPNYIEAGLATARDIRAAIAAAGREAGVDARRVVLIGRSAGGWGSIAAATLGGVAGVINFAGGRGSQGPESVCAEDRLVAAAGWFGTRSRVPELWIYSQNDRYFPPILARRVHAAFVQAGGTAQFIEVGPYGSDGHRFFDAIDGWQPMVIPFLRRIGLGR
jgi:dienelactone hydrolase